MNDDDLPLFERFTLYFDFLGTSDVATNWSKERLYEFLDLLTSIAHIQSEQDIDGSPQGDGSYRFTMTPEVTTFSDHIVVSYPLLGDEEPPRHDIPAHLRFSPLWAKFMCQDASRVLS